MTRSYNIAALQPTSECAGRCLEFQDRNLCEKVTGNVGVPAITLGTPLDFRIIDINYDAQTSTIEVFRKADNVVIATDTFDTITNKKIYGTDLCVELVSVNAPIPPHTYPTATFVIRYNSSYVKYIWYGLVGVGVIGIYVLYELFRER